MSFSGGSNRSFGRTSSSPAQKRDKKRKQDFHKHKIKFEEHEDLDLDELKSKVSIALEKLGNQVFSNEPGGYTFSNWMKSYNLLLDDFEERVDPAKLPSEYFDARQSLTAELLEPVDTSDIDADIRRCEQESDSTKLHISEALQESQNQLMQQKHEIEKIEDLKRERNQSVKELEEAQEELEMTRSKQSFFSRLFSRQSSSVDMLRNRVDSLKERDRGISQNIQQLQDNKSQQSASNTDLKDLKDRLISLQQEIGELQGRKLEREQLGERRKHITIKLAQMISRLQFKSPAESS